MVVGIESARNRVMRKLAKVGAVGSSPIVDFGTGTAIINFIYKDVKYSFKYPNETTKKRPKNGTEALSHLSWAICRLIDCDIRGILPLSKTAKEYLALEGSVETPTSYTSTPENIKDFVVLGLSTLASNDEITKTYKRLVGMYHPDRALNPEDKPLYEIKMRELNEAYVNIKKVRGIN